MLAFASAVARGLEALTTSRTPERAQTQLGHQDAPASSDQGGDDEDADERHQVQNETREEQGPVEEYLPQCGRRDPGRHDEQDIEHPAPEALPPGVLLPRDLVAQPLLRRALELLGGAGPLAPLPSRFALLVARSRPRPLVGLGRDDRCAVAAGHG